MSERETTKEAVAWLTEHGKVLGKDFVEENAVLAANLLAADLEAARRTAALNGGLTDFDDMNCDDCPGWDGESRRCVCGNRRVYWEMAMDSTFKNPRVYAVAW